MAAPRSSWKGYLRVSLVSCPVLLKGYEFEKGRYVIVSDEEMDKIQVESNRVIDVTQFVDDDQIDPLYLDSPYWLAPDGKMANETFRVIVEAMKRESKAGIGRLVLSSRERAVLLSPRGKGIMIRTLRAAEEVRREEPYFEDIEEGPLDESAVALAQQIVNQKSSAFDPKLFADRYQAALGELIKAKLKGEQIVTTEVAEPAPVIDLMAALKKSLETMKPPATSKPTRGREPGAAAEEKKAPARGKQKGSSRKAG